MKRLNLEKGEADIEGKIGSLTYLFQKHGKKGRLSFEKNVPVIYERIY